MLQKSLLNIVRNFSKVKLREVSAKIKVDATEESHDLVRVDPQPRSITEAEQDPSWFVAIPKDGRLSVVESDNRLLRESNLASEKKLDNLSEKFDLCQSRVNKLECKVDELRITVAKQAQKLFEYDVLINITEAFKLRLKASAIKLQISKKEAMNPISLSVEQRQALFNNLQIDHIEYDSLLETVRARNILAHGGKPPLNTEKVLKVLEDARVGGYYATLTDPQKIAFDVIMRWAKMKLF